MKATACYRDERLRTFFLFLLGAYAEVWVWRQIGQLEIIVSRDNLHAPRLSDRKHLPHCCT